MHSRRFLKFLHEVGTAGLMGACAAQLVLSYAAEGKPPVELAAMRQAILLISEQVLLPSLVVVLCSGLLAWAFHRPYHGALWALIKVALTVLVFEGTLFAVQGPAQTAAQVARELAAGNAQHAGAMEHILRHERAGLVVILFLSVVNIVLAVWRPTLKKRRKKPEASTEESEAAEPEENAEPIEKESTPGDKESAPAEVPAQ